MHNWPLMGAHELHRPRQLRRPSCGTPASGGAAASPPTTRVIVTIAIFAVAFPLALFVEKPRPLVRLLPHRHSSCRWSSASRRPACCGLAAQCRYRPVQPGRVRARPDRQEGQPAGDLRQPAFWSIIAMVVWKIAGFTMIILMTGLQAIPTELRRRRRSTAPGRWQRFRLHHPAADAPDAWRWR